MSLLPLYKGLEQEIPATSLTYSLMEFTTVNPSLFCLSYSHLFCSVQIAQVTKTNVRH
ncbi:hypothetical protein CXB51_025718 [Gossypium anomalum]|uniref:Uncharacterized protein n=1 Tax=Gossypium anomalum TaxID=47600 RepID=A0A8J6CRQ8_9ROSI|nr:hypothetical protein CXB51_025718 [Gossypium anomalum]